MSLTSYIRTSFGVPVTVQQGSEGEVYSECAECDKSREVTVRTKTDARVDHTIDRNFSISIGSHTVVLQETKRTFFCTWRDDYKPDIAFPTREYNRTLPSELGMDGVRYNSITWDILGNISENCSVKRTTLLYLDSGHGIVLAKSVTTSLQFTGDNVHGGRQYVAQAPGIGGADYVPEIIVLNSDLNYQQVVEYVLYKHDGTKEVLLTRTEDLRPASSGVPPPDLYGQPGPYPSLPAIANLWQIIIPKRLPKPLMPNQIQEWNATVQGFYGYTYYYCGPYGEDRSGALADGGEDFFYPEWCRFLGTDPFWLRERDMRNARVCDRSEPDSPETILKNEIAGYIETDSLPSGSYVVDADGNYFYSFVVWDDGKLYTFNNINGKPVDLPEVVKEKEGEFTSYFPVGLI